MVIHDPQEEEYAERASAESDKFDNRLFWTIGGICVLSLGYFQATDTLAISLTLVVGYSLLISALFLLLLGLRVCSVINNKWAIYFRETNAGREQNEKHENRLDKQTKWANVLFSYFPLLLSFIGIVLIVIYMFSTAIQ